MLHRRNPLACQLLITVLLFLAVVEPSQAQSIIAAPDGTDTRVNTRDGRHDIGGGTLSGDGRNLFHSFERFGLSAGEIANFRSNPQILNILSRVTGGDPSIINGLLQVTGGNSNLYLINPAGILFGANASLNIPASFTATTASGVGFGNTWFNAFGNNDYASLVGNPDSFAFSMAQPGAIANFGTLAVNPEQSLTLLGGTVLNAGTLSAPGGTITVAAVPGENRVRISQTGSLLSLELESGADLWGQPTSGNLPSSFTPLSLPELLTGGNVEGATQVTVNPDGTVTLAGSNVSIPTQSGTAIVSGTLDASTSQPSNASPEINVFGDRVLLFAANLNASGVGGGGTVRVGGDYLGQGAVPNADVTVVSPDSTIRADALGSGNGGRVIVWSDQATRMYGNISVRGGLAFGNGGFVETSSRNFLDVTTFPDISAPAGDGGTWLIDPNNISIVANGLGSVNYTDFGTGLFSTAEDSSQIEVGLITNALLLGDVTLTTGTAGANTQAGDISLDTALDFNSIGLGRTLTLNAHNNIIINGTISDSIAGADSLNLAFNANSDGVGGGNIQTNQAISTGGGNITFQGTGVGTQGIITSAPINSEGGAISFTGTSDSVQGIFVNSSGAINSGGGNITFTGTSTGTGQFSAGVELFGNITSGAGNISVTGTGVDIPGVLVNSAVTSTTGAINITGTATGTGENSYGVIVQNAFGGSLTSGSGDITITGSSAASDGIFINNPVSSASGTITLTADRINLAPGFGAPSISGSGNLILQPLTSTLNLTLGGADPANTTFLNAAELDAIANGFSSIIIGRADGSGAISLGGDVLFSDPATLRSPFGSINTTGGTLSGTDNASLNLLAGGAITTGNITNLGRDVVITSRNGAVNTQGGTINTSTTNPAANGGIVSITAASDVLAGNISTASSFGTAGDILLRSENGSINAGEATLDASSQTGNGGLISLFAPSGGITLGNARANAASILGNAGNGGTIRINAATNITVLGLLDTSSQAFAVGASSGNGGNVDVRADREILFRGSIDTHSQTNGLGGNAGNGGNIQITSRLDRVITDQLLTHSAANAVSGNSSQGGSITIDAANGSAVVTDQIITQSTAGSVSGNAGNAGAVNIASRGGLRVNGQVLTNSTAALGNAGNGGEIRFSSGEGITVRGDVNSSSQTNTGNAGNAGAVAFLSNDNIEIEGALSALSASTVGNAGNAGTIRLEAVTNIDLFGGLFATSSTGSGISGAGSGVTLLARGGSVSSGPVSIGSSSPLGQGSLTINAPTRINLSAGLFSNGADITLGNSISPSVILLPDSIDTNGGNFVLSSNGDFTSPAALSLITDGGNVNFTTTTGDLTLSGAIETNGGSINLRSNEGSLDTREATLNSGSASRNGGAIILRARGDITTADLFSSATLARGAGRISLFSETGSIDTSAGVLNSSTGVGIWGPISLNAGDDIITGDIISGSEGAIRTNNSISIIAPDTIQLGDLFSNGSDITIGSNTTRPNELRVGTINSGSGDLRILADGDVSLLRGVTTSNGGVSIQSRRGAIAANGAINSGSGTLQILGDGNVSLSGSVITSGASVSIQSRQGAIAIDSAVRTDGGSIILGGNTISTAVLDSSSISARGGSISLTANTGGINTRALNSSGTAGGAIALNAPNGAISTGDITSTGTSGGGVSVRASTEITTGAIDSSGSFGNGGDVMLDPSGDITVSSINAQGGSNGLGGTIRIATQRYFRATGTFTQNGNPVSISSRGGLGGGSITIDHGGNGMTPFISGDATTNGTAGDITSGTATISASPSESFTESVTRGNIQIRTQNLPSTGCPPSCPPDVDPPSPPTPPTDPNSGGPDPGTPPGDSDPDPGSPGEEPPDEGVPIDNPSVDEPIVEDPFANPSIPAELFQTRNLDQARDILRNVQAEAKVKFALVYINFASEGVSSELDFSQREATTVQQYEQYFNQQRSNAVPDSDASTSDDDKYLEILVVTGTGEPTRIRVPDVTRAEVMRTADRFRGQVTNPQAIRSSSYLIASQRLYRWLIAPIEAELEAQQIQNLSFIMDPGLRSLPIAALYDGQDFLVEKYSVSLMPSISLIEADYVDLRQVEILAMGASEFPDREPLPAVPVEIGTITSSPWSGKSFLNDLFTLANLRLQREDRRFGIVHLATHAEFRPGDPGNSYIQLWDQKLQLNQLRQLNLYDPPVELLVLSACRTALGDEQAELGFAGLALQAGVKSALASLWYVSDEGSLAFMTEFYRQLRVAPTKAEALRQTQIAMIDGRVRVEDGELRGSRGEKIPLPPELADRSDENLSHPFFWSAFTLVGSPW